MLYAIYTYMHTPNSSDRRAQARWQRDLAQLWPVAKGSLSEVRKPCTRPNCPACRDGRRHRVFLFCYREDGHSRCAYVPADAVTLVRQAIANGRKLERRLVTEGRALIAAQRRTDPKEPHARTQP
jgi:hypothetical protein